MTFYWVTCITEFHFYELRYKTNLKNINNVTPKNMLSSTGNLRVYLVLLYRYGEKTTT